jgi:hypothetical protein
MFVYLLILPLKSYSTFSFWLDFPKVWGYLEDNFPESLFLAFRSKRHLLSPGRVVLAVKHDNMLNGLLRGPPEENNIDE